MPGPQPLNDGPAVAPQVVQIDATLVGREDAMVDLALAPVGPMIMGKEEVAAVLEGMDGLLGSEVHVDEERLLPPPLGHWPERIEEALQRRAVEVVEDGEIQAAEACVVSSSLGWGNVADRTACVPRDEVQDLRQDIGGAGLLDQEGGVGRRERDDFWYGLEEEDVVVRHDAVVETNRTAQIDGKQDPK